MWLLSLTLFSVLSVASAYTPEALADQITNLPGTEKLDVNFNHFSGYLDIPGVSGEMTKYMHYWFVESQNKPASDPLAFWTNGGPGCSGMIGFLGEHGPFRPLAYSNDSQSYPLSLNDHAWNKLANMVYIESPASVGFSYSDDKDDLTTGDEQTAVDNYNLIQAFLVRFPEYSTNDLYLTSESYGGHYVPTLAKYIVDSNPTAIKKLNLKGIAIGNAFTDVYSGTPSSVETVYGHQVISQKMYDDYQHACGANKNITVSADCTKQMNKIMLSINYHLNPYALDYPVCLSASVQAMRQWNHQLKAMGLDTKAFHLKDYVYEPCLGDFAFAYINQESVKKAIHVRTDITFEPCSETLNYSVTDAQISTAPIYNYLIDGKFGLNILLYSGNDDSVCPTVGTQSWIWKLGYTPAVNWAVDALNGQTVGFLTKWKDTKMAFLTVHAAGHEVPMYKPEVALSLWKRFLAGELTDK